MTNYKLLPEQPTKEMLDALPSDFIRAVFIGAYPTAYTAVTVPKGESLCCDLCGAEVTDFKNDLFHHTGIINGKFNDHIHLCKKCEDDVKPPHFNFDTRSIVQQECKPLSEDKIQRLFNYSSHPINWSDLREIVRMIEKAHNI
jgi:hypothetical protein